MASAIGGLHAEAGETVYQRRWEITQVPSATITPPLELVWSRSPIWFENWFAAGFSESESRRGALVEDTLLSVIRNRLYAFDAKTGKTRWIAGFTGDEVYDWKTVDRILVYASPQWRPGAWHGARGVIDLPTQRPRWTVDRVELDGPYQPEWIIPVSPDAVIFSRKQLPPVSDEIALVDLNTGVPKWRTHKRFTDEQSEIVSGWFVLDNYLHGFTTNRKKGGVQLERFDIATGQKQQPIHLYGDRQVPNFVLPFVVTETKTVFWLYDATVVPPYIRGASAYPPLAIVASSIDVERTTTRWATPLPTYVGLDRANPRKLALGADSDKLIATTKPDEYVVLQSSTGTVLRHARLPGYAVWGEYGSLLLSYPYLFSTAWRRADNRLAYDLIALNLETGAIEWSREIERQDRMPAHARAEVLNFIVADSMVYVFRADARIMAFRAPKANRPGATSQGSGASAARHR